MTSAHVTVPARAWRSGASLERWRRVAIASVKQCGRARIPEIAPVMALDDVLGARSGKERPMLLCLPSSEKAAAPASTIRPSEALVLIGPEGGWSEDEIRRALAAGAAPLNLGPRVIRAELAPAIALASLWTRWGW
jgi:16S rRNA (uracil1498-N3)-methyltransferase